MLLRPGTPADAAAVAAVHETARRAYYEAAAGRPTDPAAVHDGDPGRCAMWTAVVADPARAEVVCAMSGDGVVGFCSPGPPLPEHPEPAAVLELHALYVLPARWGTGAGGALHDAFVERLAAGSEERGVLDVWDGNARAIGFYLRRGWVLDGRSRPAEDGTAYVGMSLPR